jgi:hypothetical protein
MKSVPGTKRLAHNGDTLGELAAFAKSLPHFYEFAQVIDSGALPHSFDDGQAPDLAGGTLVIRDGEDPTKLLPVKDNLPLYFPKFDRDGVTDLGGTWATLRKSREGTWWLIYGDGRDPQRADELANRFQLSK